jgi:hypothetical protein
MRKIILLFALAISSLAACKKESPKPIKFIKHPDKVKDTVIYVIKP